MQKEGVEKWIGFIALNGFDSEENLGMNENSSYPLNALFSYHYAIKYVIQRAIKQLPGI